MITCDNIICQLVDSAADSKLKRLKHGETFGVEKPGGEARIYVGQKTNENEFDAFFGFDKNETVEFVVYKSDLIDYLIKAKSEYKHPVESYRLDISQMYDALVSQTLELDNEFTISFKKNTDKRYYISPVTKGGNPYGKYVRSICLPLLTHYNFIKTIDEIGNINYYFKLIFNSPKEENPYQEDIEIDINSPLNEPLQQIFFGAPGTGKSFRINEVCAQYENYRTTFHPDTDYASFVGAYKPITKSEVRYDIYSKPIKDENGNVEHEDRIVYRYVFQAFLKAYIAAWREQQNENPKPVFLVVEEINRGNCAQIFGDIFQLLDRNESGYSDYPIVADDDLAQELERKFENLTVANPEAINSLYKGGKDIVGSVKSGKELLLPNNLYIWATMNTSDQSLFPIDSAFKRRWDWKYIKIKDAKKDYKIQFSNGNVYDWWSFVTEINNRIEGGEIQQEDKKLGYFFAKSKDGIITADRFLSKVIFFLYNDVFKDFGFDEDYFKGADGQPMTFASYFDEAGEPNEAQIERFLTNLGLEPENAESSHDSAEETAE